MDKQHFDMISTLPALCFMKTHISLHSSGHSCGDKLIEIHIWKIAQPVTHFDPQKKIPLSFHQAIFYLLHPIISINHPPTSFSFSSLHPTVMKPHPQLSVSVPDPLEKNWIKLVVLFSKLCDAVGPLWDVWYVTNPLYLHSDRLPALSVKLAEVKGFR